jgi:hypothetical protein
LCDPDVLFSFSFFDLTRDEAAVRSERSCQQIARAWRASSRTTFCESIFVTRRLRAQAYGGHTVVVWSKQDDLIGDGNHVRYIPSTSPKSTHVLACLWLISFMR